MLLPFLLLLLGAGALAQGPDLSSRGDRTSLIFAPSSGQSATTTGANGANGTATTTHSPNLNGTTPAPIVLPLILPTHTPSNGTKGTGGPMILPWLPTNSTGNGTLVGPTFPSLNFTAPNINFTRPNGTVVFPTFPPLNWTFPDLNMTSNGSLVLPTFAPLNWTLPGLNFTSNSTVVFPTFPSLNWTIPGLNWTTPRPGTIVFSTTTPRPFTVPGANSSSSPRPFSWTWAPTTTSRPGTGSTQRWTPPAWSGWNRTTTAGTGATRWATTMRSPVSGSTSVGTTTRSPFTSRSSFGTTTRSPVSFGRTTRYPGGSIGTTTRFPFPGVSTFGTRFPGTTTHSPLSTGVPNTLSEMLQTWRARFAADMEAVRANITQYLLH